MPRRSLSTLKQRTRRLEEGGRAALAGWVGQPVVTEVVTALRPEVQALVEGFELADDNAIITAAGVLTSVAGLHLDRSEWPNPFLAWTAQQRDAAQPAVMQLRRLLANLTMQLRKVGIGIDAVSDDAEFNDHYGFSADHLHLLVLLWLPIPLVGRSGAEIAAELPVLPTVGWERHGDALNVSIHATDREVRDAFALRRVWKEGQGEQPLAKPYARGGTRRRPRAEPVRDARGRAVGSVAERFPEVTAGELRDSWQGDASTAGGLLRQNLGYQPWDPAPSESTLRTDLRALNR